MSSRVQNSKKNIIFTLLNYLLKTVLTFVVQKLIIDILGMEYLGINGLFTNILSLLSLAELGFGSAMVFAMYKPMAENDTEKLKSLLALYKKIYSIIGIIICAIGLLLMPFLRFLINKDSEIPQGISIYIVFAIFLFQSVSSYFFAYRRSLLYTAQRNDVESKVAIVTTLFLNTSKIAILYLWPNYYLFLGVVAVFTIIENVIIYFVTKKMFPEITGKNIVPLDDESKKSIKKNVFALIYHKIGSVVVYSTDVLVIAKFLKGLDVVGKYSNYLLIVTAVTSVIGLIATAIKGSIGNVIAKSSPESNHELFQTINFGYSWMIGFCAIALICLMNPFIKAWYGEGALLGFEIVLLLSVNFYFLWVKNMAGAFKECAGLFWQDRYKSLVESVVNLVTSILLVIYLGLPGVIIGTIISTVTVCFWVEPKVLYKHYFKTSAKPYWIRFFVYTLVTVICGGITYFVCSLIPDLNLWTLIAKFAICAIVPNALFVICYCRTKAFKAMLEYIKKVFQKNKKETV